MFMNAAYQDWTTTQKGYACTVLPPVRASQHVSETHVQFLQLITTAASRSIGIIVVVVLLFQKKTVIISCTFPF
jgi:hypothetical protein